MCFLSENLNSVVSEVDDDDLTVGRDADAAWSVKFTGTGSGSAESADEDALRREDLNPVVAGVGDDDVTLLVNRNSVGTSEVAVLRTLSTEELCELEV